MVDLTYIEQELTKLEMQNTLWMSLAFGLLVGYGLYKFLEHITW